MLRLLERNIASVQKRLVVLPPLRASISSSFGNVRADRHRHSELRRELQRLRGDVYLRDGAIGADALSADGRHVTREDESSWHLLILDDERRVSGCIWYLEHEQTPSFEHLRVRDCPLVDDDPGRARLRSAVESEIARAQREHVRYAEVGGWALAKHSRVSDCLLLLLSTYGLSQVLGGAFVLAMATARHSSAAILRRIGGAPLQANGCVIPPYYDPRYKCAMELLGFDTRRPSPRFEPLVAVVRARFTSIPLVAGDRARGESIAEKSTMPAPFGLRARMQPRAAIA